MLTTLRPYLGPGPQLQLPVFIADVVNEQIGRLDIVE